jgi:uncharacterized protein YjiS (DUF1127 family)
MTRSSPPHRLASASTVPASRPQPPRGWETGWFARFRRAVSPRRLFARLGEARRRPRLDPQACSDHMLKDIGLSAPHEGLPSQRPWPML